MMYKPSYFLRHSFWICPPLFGSAQKEALTEATFLGHPWHRALVARSSEFGLFVSPGPTPSAVSVSRFH
jgi:hypothetical protein